MNNTELISLYGEDYFADRFENEDPKRELSFKQEYSRIKKYLNEGAVLDVGCGMGNFLDIFDEGWNKHGIEISEYARGIAVDKGIRMIDYDYEEGSMDLVVFRGTLQHLDTPLLAIRKCIDLLKPGGYMVFLATPNTNSLCYRLFRDLPALDPERNFLLPSDVMLKQILENFNLEVMEFVYPYFDSPYSSPVRDHIKLLLRLFGAKNRFAFWHNMMECYARKRKV